MGLGAHPFRSTSRTTRLDPGADAPAQARWFLWSSVARHGMPPEMETASLLVSELVSNAVRHADADHPIDVSVIFADERIRVSVRDRGPVFRPERSLGDRDRYGLRLIDALAERWGGRAIDGGMEVWFEL